MACAANQALASKTSSRRVSWRLRPSVTLCALSRGLASRPIPARAFGAGRLVVLHLRQQMIARLDHARRTIFLTVLGVEREQAILHAERFDQLRRGSVICCSFPLTITCASTIGRRGATTVIHMRRPCGRTIGVDMLPRRLCRPQRSPEALRSRAARRASTRGAERRSPMRRDRRRQDEPQARVRRRITQFEAKAAVERLAMDCG